MRSFRTTFAALCCTTAVLFLPPLLSAQSDNGVIVGRITDASNAAPLPGATIRIEGTTLGGVSNRNGEYRIANVPAGEQKVRVEYLGYETTTARVAVQSGSAATQNFALIDEIAVTDTVQVRAIRQGQARALNQQKNADNIVNIVAADQIGRFPDPNTAEAIQRIPGVSLQRDQGEGRYVQIRGSDPRLTNVTINGDQIPAPEGDIRYAALDVIPADQLASIEVNKAITPDMDADGIGGSVNLTTKEAYSESTILKGTVAGGYNNIVSDANFQAALTYGKRTGDEGKFGYLFSGSYYRTNRGSDNNEFEWGDEEFDGTDRTVLQNLEFRDYVITRDRLGLSGTLDFKPSPQSSIWLRGIYNRFGDDEHRYRLRLRFDEGDYDSPTQTSGSVVERELKDRYEVQDIYSAQIGGNTPLFGAGTLDGSVSYSFAQEEEPNRRDMTFAQEDVDLSYGLADPSFPTFSITNGADIYNASAYEFEDIVVHNNLTTDRNITANLDYKLPFAIGDNRATVQIGGKFRSKEKERTNDIRVMDDFDGESLTMDQVAGDASISDNFLDGRYEIGSSPDPDRVKDFYEANTDKFGEDTDDSREETDPTNYTATEQTIAGYAMARGEFGKFSALAGARYEQINIEYTGNEVVFNEEGDYEITNKVNGENDYGKLFPMVHLRYALTDRTNLRAAWTNTQARPNYYDLVPYRIVKREDEELALGNPMLEATTAMNFDFMAEHYFASVGVLSGGFFYKGLENYIYATTSETVGGSFDGYEATQPVNGESATLFGIELNWQQQLSFLPGALDGLGIYANYTFTDSEAEVPGRDEKITLPGQAQHVGNVALSYEKFGFSGRVALNFSGEFISEVGEEAADDIYYDKHVQLDVSLSQRITDNIRIFADLINLTDAPLRYYQGSTDRPIAQEYYSWWSHIGVRFDL